MAKKKLTIEDMLVPKDEIPYEVPENWCWVKLKFISSIISKGTTPKGGKSAYIDSGVKFLRVENINDYGYIDLDNIKYISEDTHLGFLKRSILFENDILISIAGTLGKTAIVREDDLPLNTNQAIAFIRLKDTEKILPKYIKLFLSSPQVIKELLSQTKVTAIPNLTLEIVGDCKIALPPLAEQERIVNRVENLFDKVDRAAELVEEARYGFEKRRAAILEMAFSGELTKGNLVNDNEIDLSILSKDSVEFDIPCEIPSNWKWLKFNECCTFLGSGVTPKGGSSVYSEKGTPFIRSQNVLKGILDMSDVVYISDEIQEKMKRTTVYSKDTLLNITGASIGRCAYVPDDIEEANVNQHVCILRFKEYIDYKYPSYWINSPIFQNIINKEQIGATRQALNFKQLRGMWIPVPPIEEQRKIVDILDRLMDKEKEISELSDMDYNIESIKKSILAKAFRGELGSNNLDEESSIELLKELIK